MTRAASSAFLDELHRATGARPFVLIEALFDGDPWRSWTGTGELLWNERRWIGLGTIISISPPMESADGRANPLTLRMNSGSGVDPSKYIANVLATHVQGRRVRLWWGFMTDQGAIVADPLLIYSGFMDQPRIIDQGRSCAIEMGCEQELIDQSRAARFRMSPQRLQEKSPGDRGFDYLAGIEERTVPWPRAGFG